jgi:hypothetical protein
MGNRNPGGVGEHELAQSTIDGVRRGTEDGRVSKPRLISPTQ